MTVPDLSATPEIPDKEPLHDTKLDDLLFAWLYAHQDVMAGKIPAESVTAPYKAIQQYFASRTSERVPREEL